MNKKEAEQLLEEVFHNPFDEKRFLEFITEFLNGKTDTDKKPAIWASSTFKDYIVNSKCLGTYIDTNKKTIAIVTVELKKTKSVEKARTIQRNFIANYLNKSGLDAAIIAFYGDYGDDWRLSFVKLEYKNVNVGNKLKSETELTPVKRYSYLVGKHEANHTCKSQLSPILQDDKLDTTLEEIEKAFSVDKVTKEFFDKYKELFFRLNDSLTELMKKDKKIQKEFEEKDIKPDEFSKKLLGQIVFLFFLQKKGWMGIQKDKEGDFENWGTGPKDFLQKLYNKKYLNYDNFFNDVLEPLFYEALAKDRRDNSNYYSKLKCKIPFLNGGLFEPINDYSWEKTDILIDNDIFKEILDVFSQYNFTVKEDEPLEKEVAVDPEMLGKVFENLLEIRDRKSKGSYYTPREIVHYMCQQSLINYLETNLEPEKVPKEDIEYFILNGDLTLAELIKEQEEKKQGNTYATSKRNYELPDLIKKNFKKIDTLLKEVKIADPAVGSGAFPVGMMNEIVKARSIISALYSKKEQEERTNYNLKRETIENSLYGVDIDPAAVEISKLRFWLSLIVDEDDIDHIKPLPNLDNKIMCGNSLLDSFEGVKLIDENLFKDTKKERDILLVDIKEKLDKLYKEKGQVAIGKSHKDSKEIEKQIKYLEKQKQKSVNPKEKLEYTTISDALQKKVKESKKKLLEMQKLQKEYFNEEDRLKKKAIFKQIENIEWGFIEEKLKEQNSQEALVKLQQIKRSKSKPFFIWELYFCDVFNRQNSGFDIVIGNPPYVEARSLEQSDVNSYRDIYFSAGNRINTFALFTEKGIKLLSNKNTLAFIIHRNSIRSNDYRHLREYILKYTTILNILSFKIGVFDNVTGEMTVMLLKKTTCKNNDIKICFLDKTIKGELNYSVINQDIFRTLPDYRFNIYLTKNIILILNKINKFERLENYAEVTQGIIVGDEKKYIKKEGNFDKYKPILRGKDISRYKVNYNGEYLFYVPGTQILKRGKTPELFEVKQKILTQHVCSKIVAAIDTDSYYYLQTINGIILKNKDISYEYLLSILNSKALNFFYEYTFNMGAEFTTAVAIENLNLLPIPNINKLKQKPFIDLVNKILTITKDEDYLGSKSKQQKVKQLEAEIDQLVYKLYELTPEEIKIVEGST